MSLQARILVRLYTGSHVYEHNTRQDHPMKYEHNKQQDHPMKNEQNTRQDHPMKNSEKIL